MAMRDKQIIVIGAGPSGLMAAIFAARRGAKVQILERMNKPGRKLLLTGNGRCNMTNLDSSLPSRYCSDEPEAAERMISRVLCAFSATDTIAFFEKLGVAVYDRDGYVYPHSGQAESVLNALLHECGRLGVRIRCDTQVLKLEKDKTGQWNVCTTGWTYRADAVILCAGSKAAPETGSDGSGYTILQNLGHSIISPVPALTALTVSDGCPVTAAGDRCRAAAALQVDGITRAVETGELQWIKDGISGVAVFSLSRHATRALQQGRKVSVMLDLAPGYDMNDLCRLISFRAQAWPEENGIFLLQGIVPSRTAKYITQRFGEIKDIQVLTKLLKSLPLTITGSRDFPQAQTCAGGISLTEVEQDSLCSTIHKGLYFAGEILDIDGPCGGYNLQWAFASGAAAGRAASNAAG